MVQTSTLINGDTLHDTITIDKQSGTVVTLGTSEKYLEKNIRLTLNVQAGSVRMPMISMLSNPAITVSDTGLVTASYSVSTSATPTISAGYVSTGAAGTVRASGTSTYQLPVATVSETRAYLGIA